MKPKTRLENFLARIARDPDATEMDPKTRKEHYLNKIAEGNGLPGGSYYVEISGSGNDFTADKSPEEISNAYASGLTVFCRLPRYERGVYVGDYLYPLVGTINGFLFEMVAGGSGSAELRQFFIAKNGDVTYTTVAL